MNKMSEIHGLMFQSEVAMLANGVMCAVPHSVDTNTATAASMSE